MEVWSSLHIPSAGPWGPEERDLHQLTRHVSSGARVQIYIKAG